MLRHLLTNIQGGVIDIGPEHIDAVVQAFANYDVNGQADKKAALNAALGKVPGVVRSFSKDRVASV